MTILVSEVCWVLEARLGDLRIISEGTVNSQEANPPKSLESLRLGYPHVVGLLGKATEALVHSPRQTAGYGSL